MRVGWILCDGIMGASSRMNGIIIHNWFNANGIDSRIIAELPATPVVPRSEELERIITEKEVTHLVFQKVCLGAAIDYLELAKGCGIKTIYTMEDLIQEGIPMAQRANVTITNSEYVRNALKIDLNIDSITIYSPYESPRDLCKQNYVTDKIKVYWFGTLGSTPSALALKETILDLKYTYDMVCPPPACTIPWTLQYYNDLVKADIIVIPQLDPWSPWTLAKGENRLVSAMVLGVPVIASPYPSYVKLIKHGENGLLCKNNTIVEFTSYLNYLGEEEFREEIGRAGRATVVDKYTMDNVGKMWVEAFELKE